MEKRIMRTKLTMDTYLKSIKSYVVDPLLQDTRSKRIMELWKKQLTQHEIAEIMNISQATVGRALKVGMK